MAGIVDMMRKVVVLKPKAAIFFSGGLDSTIVLHHLCEQGKGIKAYTARFGEDEEDCRFAREVAKLYGISWEEVEIKNFIKKLPWILSGFDRPRYNVWLAYLTVKAAADGRKVVYAGEGSDEHFGGYSNPDKTYLRAWADHFSFIRPTYEQVCRHSQLDLELPFTKLFWEDTHPYYWPSEKIKLREAYHKILPDAVLNREKAPPEFSNYWKLWKKEIQPHFPYYEPKSVEDIKEVLQFLATEAWLKGNSVKGKRYESNSDSSIYG